MLLNKITTYYKQFGVLNSIRFLSADFIRKILDPHNLSSYSQVGEDRILHTIIGYYSNGFYVEVGCNHPQAYSNTFNLYKRGWRGITIDANEALVLKHRKLRKQDISVCAVISDNEQEVIFTDFEDSLVSSLDQAHVDEYRETRTIKSQRSVKALTLNQILKSHEASYHFDLLSIDVEGHDFEVLSSLDLHIYRPKLIVIEMHDFDLLYPEDNKVYSLLKSHSYKMLSYAKPNGYFIDMLTETFP